MRTSPSASVWMRSISATKSHLPPPDLTETCKRQSTRHISPLGWPPPGFSSPIQTPQHNTAAGHSVLLHPTPHTCAHLWPRSRMHHRDFTCMRRSHGHKSKHRVAANAQRVQERSTLLVSVLGVESNTMQRHSSVVVCVCVCVCVVETMQGWGPHLVANREWLLRKNECLVVCERRRLGWILLRRGSSSSRLRHRAHAKSNSWPQ